MGAFDDMELNLEEDLEEEEGGPGHVEDPYATPTAGGHSQSRLPAHFLTSTPYQQRAAAGDGAGGEPGAQEGPF